MESEFYNIQKKSYEINSAKIKIIKTTSKSALLEFLFQLTQRVCYRTKKHLLNDNDKLPFNYYEETKYFFNYEQMYINENCVLVCYEISCFFFFLFWKKILHYFCIKEPVKVITDIIIIIHLTDLTFKEKKISFIQLNEFLRKIL